MTFLRARVRKRSLLSGPVADDSLDALPDLTRIQWVTGVVLSADFCHTVCGLHI